MDFLHISMLYVNISALFWRGAFWVLEIPFMTYAASSRFETFLITTYLNLKDKIFQVKRN